MLKQTLNFFALLLLCAFCLPTNAEIVDQSGLLNGYSTVYELNIPTNPTYKNANPSYSVNNAATLAAQNYKIEKAGYYLSLTSKTDGTTEWVAVTMDPFTSDYSKMGVPTFKSGAVFQQYVTNMTYKSNAASLNTATLKAADGITVTKANIEFWPTNYNTGNGKSIPNASKDLYDFGDTREGGGDYGSMQIHDYSHSTVVMAFNNWNNGSNCVGIGSNTKYEGNGRIHPDWTFVNSASHYSDRQLGVYVKYFFSDIQDTNRAAVEADAADMERVYQYNLSKGGRTPTQDFTSGTSLSGMPIDRVGYYYRLEKTDGTVNYAYVSYDSLELTDRTKLGIPNNNNFTWQTSVNDMTVYSNVAGVVNGTGLTGNVEIWSTDYSQGNAKNVPGASGSTFDFGDTKTSGGNGHGSFQIHNTAAKQTVIAYNNHGSSNPSVGIGNQPTGHPDWTFNANANTYASVTLDVLASAAIAPKMAEAMNGDQYTVVQGARISQQATTNWHNEFKYDIVNNASAMKADGVMFDRVGYYIEYAPNYGDELRYAFVSMDAFTDDITKIGVPVYGSNIFWQQTVKNLEVSSNVTSSEGIITTGSFHEGYLEFWPSNYANGKSNVITAGSGAVYDINDSGGNSTSAGHGSMQVHNLDTGETVFAVNSFNASSKQFGIGTNPNASTTSSGGQKDWTFYDGHSNYKISNIYTFVRESDAVLTLDDSATKGFYQRHDNQATVDLAGTIKLAAGASVDKIQVSSDGTTWTDLTLDGTSYSGSVTLDAGWHTLDVRAIDANGITLTSTKTGKIGVGDIFITAGQSNATNCGDAAQSTVSGNVVSLNLANGRWETANDPQPLTINGKTDGSNRGSTWPAFGDAISEMSGVPVGIVSVGWSGSNINQWNPAKVDTSAAGWESIGFNPTDQTLYGRLALAINELDGDFTAVLWHQGESNWNDTTYAEKLSSLIEAAWNFANENFDSERFPWMVALVSANGNEQINDVVREQQLAVINLYDEVFQGPDSDKFLGDYRGLNGNHIHFSELGLQALGQAWGWEVGTQILQLPEPSTWVLMILGIGMTLGIYKRDKRFCKNSRI